MTAPYQTTTLKNGVALLLRPMPQAQSVAVGIWVRAGGRYESPEQAGISHMLEHLLFKGTRRRSCEELKRQIEGVGGTLNGFTAEEFTCYMAKVPRRFARRGLEVLADMVCRPRLAEGDLARERDVVLEEIRMYEDSPGQLVHDLFNQLLWPNHPLGMLLSGTVDTVRRIRRQDLIRYWRQTYQSHGLIATCTGAWEPDAWVAEARRTLGGLRGSRVRRFLRAPRPRRGMQVRVWRKATEQTHLCVGTYAIPRTHPDRFALELLHVLLGGNMSSRLFREVREKRGLAYEIGTQIKRFDDTGAFVVYAGCDAGKVEETVATVFRELQRMRRGRVGRAELRRAKDFYAGQLLMGLEDTLEHMLWIGEQAVTAGRVAQPEFLLTHLERVTATDIRRVASRLFQVARMHLALIGPIAESTQGRLARLWRGA